MQNYKNSMEQQRKLKRNIDKKFLIFYNSICKDIKKNYINIIIFP